MSTRLKRGVPLGLILLAVCLALNHETVSLDGAPAPVFRERRQLQNSIGMKFVRVPAGKFFMGSPKEEKYHHDSEEPRHEVEITKPFYLGIYEVTQAQYKKVMGNNPSFYSASGKAKKEVKGLDTDDFPVEMVSWHDAKEFCAKLTALPAEKKAGRAYRLPTEAEWEYACRAGTTTAFHYGKTLSCKEANFDDRYHDPGVVGRLGTRLSRPTTVGAYNPNAFGVYDMHGNIWEWCEDRMHRDYYKESPRKDPPGASGNELGREEVRIIRGGSYFDAVAACRSSSRYCFESKSRTHNVGFRIVGTPP